MAKAEIIWALKIVDSNFSFQSSDDLLPVLRVMFKQMSLGSDKVSYVIAYGLQPYFKRMVIRGIQAAPGYTLGTDAGTFRLHGSSKIIDCMFRFRV